MHSPPLALVDLEAEIERESEGFIFKEKMAQLKIGHREIQFE